MATRYPVSSIVGMRQAMDRLVNDTFSPSQFGTIWPASTGDKGRALAPIDAYVTEHNVVILAAIPGVTAGDIDISIEKNTVTLTGEVPSVVKSDHAKGANWYLHELPSGSFRRSLTMPIDVDASKAEATFESGVLRLTLPKAEAAKPRQIQVQVGSGQPEAPAISEATDQE
ncbi:MAG: Hsp20/alpha crystallin family protein [Chloroflexia bacterium]|nr:Hsp20/alpha crystallin family protein [Chloroflexia bacterium]